MSTATLITAEEFSGMSFDKPVELVRGEIVEMTNPAMRHGEVCSNISLLLRLWDRQHRRFVVATNDASVLTQRDPDSIRGPDVLVISRDRLPERKSPIVPSNVPPEVAVEVLSPSDRWPDVIAKVAEYLAADVREVWVVDSADKSVFVFLHEDHPTELGVDDVLTSRALDGFSCSVSDFFEGL